MAAVENSEPANKKATDNKFGRKAGFLIYVSSVSVIAGFGLALARSRKSNPNDFKNVNNEGSKLAMKALGYGTLLSITGCGLLTIIVCKMLGVTGPKEFGLKMKDILPSKDGEFVHKFDNWPTKFPKKPDDGKWYEEMK